MSSSSSSSPEIAAATSADDPIGRFSYADASREEVMEDLSSRFILNLPDEELSSLGRICFQVEQAHWYYEDFIREENPSLPSLPLKKFSEMLFHACPLLHQWSHDHEQAFNTFMQYKTRVPVCGAIMLNDTWDKCVLVKGWKASSGWGFPKGKINEAEPPATCAIRELLEETGYNLAGQLDPQDVIEMSIKEQKVSLYIVPGVPESFPFKTKTRKEISKIEWFRLIDLPTWKRNKQVPGKFYLISPFIGALKAFINERKPRNGPRKGNKAKKPPLHQNQNINLRTEQDVLPTAENDAAQESSSSSVDQVGPQTPSPQYTESTAKPVVVADDSSILSGSIDPHFARLLSSLTLSASGASGGDSNGISPVAVPQKAAPVKPSAPVSITTLPSVPEKVSEPAVTEVDWSSSAPSRLSDRVAVSPQQQLSDGPSTSPKPKPSLHTKESFSSIQQRTQSPRPAVNGVNKENNQLLSPIPPTVTSPVSATSPRTAASQRPSGPADISPYLSRSMEVPTSAKRLKQLALLESIADESARMTPIIAARAAAATPMGGANPNTGYPLPSAVHTQSPFTMNRNPNDMSVLYSTGHAAPGPASPIFNPGPPPMRHDPFQVRARTSQAFHRNPIHPAPGSMSMNQSQLLALMNNAGPPPVPAPLPQSFFPPQPIPGQQYPSFYSSTPGPGPSPMFRGYPPPPMHHPMSMQGPIPSLPPYPGPSHPSTSPFLTRPPTQPVSPSYGFAQKVPQASANALLSILNEGKPVHGASGVATVPTMNP